MSSLHHILYTLRASSSTKRLFSSYLSFECVFLATFCLYLLNTQKNLKSAKKLPEIFGRLVDLFSYQIIILFCITYNTFLGRLNSFILWRARITVIFIPYNCQTFLPWTTTFFISLFISILCGTRYWRDFHEAQLINKSTTYNIFEQPSKTSIHWCTRLTGIFVTYNCQRIFELKKRKMG